MLHKDGSVTSSSLQSYATELTPTDDKHIAPKKYVDDSIDSEIAAIPAIDVPQTIISYTPAGGNESLDTTNDVFDVTVAALTGNLISKGTKITCRKGGKDKIYTFSEDITIPTLTGSTTTYIALEITNDTSILTNADVTVHLLTNEMVWKDLASASSYSGDIFYYDGINSYIDTYANINAGTATAKRAIMLGELTTDASEVTDKIAYAFNRRFRITNITLPATEGVHTIGNHNLGCTLPLNRFLFIKGKCLSDDAGYVAGDDNVYIGGFAWWFTRKLVKIVVRSTYLPVYDPSSGDLTVIDVTKWEARIAGGNF